MAEFIQVMTTAGKKEDAQDIANSILRKRLAGCVQVIGPIASAYWWKGDLETSEEWLCLVKTRMELYSKLEDAIRAVHPYEEPEILAVPVSAGSKGYLDWLARETSSQGQGQA